MWGGAHITGDPIHLNWAGLFYVQMLPIIGFTLVLTLRLILRDTDNLKHAKKILISSLIVFVMLSPAVVKAVLSITPRLHLFARGIEGIVFLAVVFASLTIPLYIYERFLVRDNEVLS